MSNALCLLGEWVLFLLFFFFKHSFWSKSVTAPDPAQQLKHRQRKYHFSVQMVNYTRPHMPIASQGALQWKSSTQSPQQKLHWSFLFCLTGPGLPLNASASTPQHFNEKILRYYRETVMSTLGLFAMLHVSSESCSFSIVCAVMHVSSPFGFSSLRQANLQGCQQGYTHVWGSNTQKHESQGSCTNVNLAVQWMPCTLQHMFNNMSADTSKREGRRWTAESCRYS